MDNLTDEEVALLVELEAEAKSAASTAYNVLYRAVEAICYTQEIRSVTAGHSKATIENIPSLNACYDGIALLYLLYSQKPVVSALMKIKIYGNTESKDEISYENHKGVMPLLNKAG